eukprot:7379504-Prymnesium_polylepis.1
MYDQSAAKQHRNMPRPFEVVLFVDVVNDAHAEVGEAARRTMRRLFLLVLRRCAVREAAAQAERRTRD